MSMETVNPTSCGKWDQWHSVLWQLRVICSKVNYDRHTYQNHNYSLCQNLFVGIVLATYIIYSKPHDWRFLISCSYHMVYLCVKSAKENNKSMQFTPKVCILGHFHTKCPNTHTIGVISTLSFLQCFYVKFVPFNAWNIKIFNVRKYS